MIYFDYNIQLVKLDHVSDLTETQTEYDLWLMDRLIGSISLTRNCERNQLKAGRLRFYG